MRKILFVMTASLFVFGKCNKDEAGVTASADLLILTNGSNFTYETVNGSTTSTFKLTVTNKDTVVNYNNTGDKTYKVLSNSAGANNYWAKIGSDYYRFGAFAGLTTSGVEELYVKDAAVNTVWSATVPVTYMSTNLNVTAGYKITETDITKTVAGKTYTGVTHVVLTLNTTFSGFPISLGGGDFYYAKGIGMINFALSVGNTTLGIPTTAQSSNLIAYEIK